MTDPGRPLAELPRKAGGADVLRAVAEAVVRLLVESDVDGRIGATRHERSPNCLTPGSAPSSGASPSFRRPWSREG